MASALVCSLLLALVGRLGLGVDSWAESLLLELDFGDVLMKGMLSFLLFAGALHVDLGDLVQRKWSILSLATGGVVLSTFLVGTGIYFVLPLFGLDLLFGYALLFGALISPTDPIAVLGILRSANAPRRLEATIIGESLFNDGVGVVVFTMILELVAGGHGVSAFEVGELFLTEALGGVVFGLGLGYVAYRLLKTVDDHVVELLITLSLVSGGYVLAGALHTSGPIAMVVAGLFIGNHGRIFGMSDGTRQYQDVFWELIDELLNAVLFVMIGFRSIHLCRSSDLHPQDIPPIRPRDRAADDLGWYPWRHLHRAGPVHTPFAQSGRHTGNHLYRGRLLDPGARSDRGTGRSMGHPGDARVLRTRWTT
jgi:CPA1 family monovalent cation:H+ antiporter